MPVRQVEISQNTGILLKKARLLANGNPLVQALVDAEEKDGWVRMCNSEGNFVGVYQWDEKRDRYFPVKMF